MRDPLKEFIDLHRPEMDAAEPSPEVWTKIEKNMILATSIPAKPSSWLKYFTFGASVITIAVVYSVTRPHYSSASAPDLADKNPVTNTVPAAEVKNTNGGLPNSPVTITENAAASEMAKPLSTNFELPLRENKTATLFGNVNSQAQEEKSIPAFPQQNNPGPAQEQVFRYGSGKSDGASISIDTLFTGITRLEVTGSSFDANVKGSTRNDLHISGILRSEKKGYSNGKSAYEVVFTRKDTVLQMNIILNCEKKNTVVVGCSIQEAKLDFELPEKINLIVHNNYGDTKVSGMGGPVLDLRTNSGDVVIENIHTNPKVTATYGDIEAHHIAGNFYGRSSSGSATVTDVTGNVDIATTYGDQEISHVTGNMKLAGSSGSILMTEITGDINVNTTYGDIKLVNYKGTPRLVTSSGNITGEQIELTGNANFITTYGDITMGILNELDALSFDLATTYGDLLVDKNGQRIEKENKLSLQKGSILIKASTSSGSQSYR